MYYVKGTTVDGVGTKDAYETLQDAQHDAERCARQDSYFYRSYGNDDGEILRLMNYEVTWDYVPDHMDSCVLTWEGPYLRCTHATHPHVTPYSILSDDIL